MFSKSVKGICAAILQTCGVFAKRLMRGGKLLDSMITADSEMGNHFPIGISVALVKYPLAPPISDHGVVLGYYDHMELVPAYEWRDLSPDRVPAREVSRSTLSISSCPIKLIFPDRSNVPFSGTLWWQDALASDGRKLGECPCLSLALINLTDVFKQGCGHLVPADDYTSPTGQFGKLICSALDADASERFAVLKTLGYSDLCLLYAGANWDPMLEVLNVLQGSVVLHDGRYVPVLSTEYLVPALNARADCASDIRFEMSMQVHLKPGVTPDRFVDTLKPDSSPEILQTSGATEWLLQTGGSKSITRQDWLNLVTRRNGQSEFIGSESTLLRKCVQRANSPLLGHAGELFLPYPTTVDEALENLLRQINDYRMLIRETYRSGRQCAMLENTAAVIDDVCHRYHNGNLQSAITPWLEAFSLRLEQVIRNLTAMKNDEHLWDELDDTLSDFETLVGGFVADLSRSDCFSMEKERYNHPSVASATALILAYTRWQNEFAARFAAEDSGNANRYIFLVTSGGCELTGSSHLFAYLSPFIPYSENDSFPVVTQMAEVGLYDCSGTIMRMAHECMHFCGNRRRAERVKRVLETIARSLAVDMSRVLFHREDWELFAGATPGDVNDLWKAAHTDIERIQQACILHFNESIADFVFRRLDKRWVEDFESISGEDHLLRSALASWLHAELWDLVWESSTPESTEKIMTQPVSAQEIDPNCSRFEDFVMCEQARAVSDFFRNCEDLCDSRATDCEDTGGTKYWRILADICALIARKIESDSGSAATTESATEQQRRRLVLSTLAAMYCETPPDEMPPDETPLDEGTGLRMNNLPSISGLINNVLDECFGEYYADIRMCSALRPDFAEYVMMFLYEPSDPVRYLKMNPAVAKRAAVIHELLFREDNDGQYLSDKSRERLTELLTKDGHPEAGTEVAKILNATITWVTMDRWQLEPVMEYLRLFVNCVPEGIAEYRTRFQHVRHLEEHGTPAQLLEALVTPHDTM